MIFSQLEAEIQYYRSQHTTTGCKLTHLFGVPMIALSFPMLFFNYRRAMSLFVMGWILQFIGHFVFEKNSPVLFSKGTSPVVLIAALLVVGQLWVRVIFRQPLQEDSSHNGRHLPNYKKLTQ